MSWAQTEETSFDVVVFFSAFCGPKLHSRNKTKATEKGTEKSDIEVKRTISSLCSNQLIGDNFTN